MNQTNDSALRNNRKNVNYVLTPSNDNSLTTAKLATRLAFFIAGFGLSCWAPLVPFAQARMQTEPAMLGIVLLCLGLGAVIGMPIAGGLSGKIGSKWVIIAGALGLALALPLLATLSTPTGIGMTLFLFGASMGATDVAANVHGTEVQQKAGVPLMSGFHGFYSIGGLAGAGIVTVLIASGIGILSAALIASGIILISLLRAWKGFVVSQSEEEHPLFVLPKGKVIIIGLLAMIIFLAEGAMLDWGALLLIQVKKLDANIAGTGYVVFAVTMALSRFVGDRMVAMFGNRAMLFAGFIFTGVGILLTAWLSSLVTVFIAIAIAGLSAGNVVPVLFTLAGKQKSMPATLAISAASILAYLGVLLGPALIGFIAHYTGLPSAFMALAVALIVSTLLITSVTTRNATKE